MMRPICPSVLLVVLPALLFVACLPEPRTGCRTTDDCASARVCVAGTCQALGHASGLDARYDGQSSGDMVIDPPERPSPDLADGLDGARDLTGPAGDRTPDAPAAIDAPESAANLDVSSEGQSSGDVPSADETGDSGVAPDLPQPLVDLPRDAPVPTIDAPESPDSPGTDAPASGGSGGTGGTAAAGGTTSAGGTTTAGGAGGTTSTGGSSAVGGTTSTGGSCTTGGSTPTGGTTSTGGAMGGAPGSASGGAPSFDGPLADVPLDGPVSEGPDGPSSDRMDCDGSCDLANAWELIGGTPVSGPGVIQWGPGQNIDLFWRGTDDHLKHKWFPCNDAWSPEQDLGGTLASEPAAVSRPTNMRDVFWRGADNHLKHRWYPLANDWSWEQDLGGTLASSPAAASWGTVALHVFWQGPDGMLKHKSMDYATNIWTDEIDLGIPVQSDPAAHYENNGVINVFWRGSSGTLQHIWSYDGAYWSTNWTWVQDLGGAIAADSSPTATGRRDGWIDVFWKGTDNHLKHIWMNTMSEWSLIEEDLGGDLASSPGATFWGAQRLDVFAKDAPTGQMAHLVWNEDSVVTVNDTDPGIAYAGDWTYVPARGLWDYRDDVHYSIADGNYIEYTFSGTGVEYVTEKFSDQGNVDVYIDEAFQQTVSCYNSTRLAQQVAYSKKGLASGSHTIRISKKDGYFMVLDALRFYP